MKKQICERCIGKIQGGWVLRYELGDSYRYNLTLIGERNCILQINGDRLIDWTGQEGRVWRIDLDMEQIQKILEELYMSEVRVIGGECLYKIQQMVGEM